MNVIRKLNCRCGHEPGSYAAFAQDGTIIVKDDEVGGVYEGTLKTACATGRVRIACPTGSNTPANGSKAKFRAKGVTKYPDGSVYEGRSSKVSRKGAARSFTPMAAAMTVSGPTGPSTARASQNLPMARAMRVSSGTHNGTARAN